VQIPSFLKGYLTPEHLAHAEAFLLAEGHSVLKDLESGSASYHWEIRSSNIGDELVLVYRGKRCLIESTA
jgi:hypothetical protein